MTSDVLKQIWPEWEIEEKPLGKGSFGVVYKAVRSDYNVKSYAAIKVISIPSDSSEVDSLRSEGLDINATRTFLRGIVDDFVNEIQLMESLKGVQNIVSVEDYKVVEKTGEIGWDIFIRMELLTTLNTYTCDKKLTEEEVIRLGCDICSALEICGQSNIIHRDIKPENIFINKFGFFKLGDFGIARKLENMTGGLSQKGTFNYMAPEVATGNNYDSRVDTYSLGIVLYRLLNGNRLPFLDTEKQLLNPNERKNAVDRRLRGEALPAPCDASPAMVDVILRACAYDPNMRFSSATEMKQALMSVANGTYLATGAGDLNATIPIHGTPAVSGRQADQSVNTETEAGDPNGTISVRKAPDASNQQAGQNVSTFGPVPDSDASKRKKLKMIITIASAASVACAALVLAIVMLPKVINNPSPNMAVGDVSSSSEDSVIPVSSSTALSSSSAPTSSSITTTTVSSSAPVSSSTTTTSSSSKSSSSSSTTTTSSSHELPSDDLIPSFTGPDFSIFPEPVTIFGISYLDDETSLCLPSQGIADKQLKQIVPEMARLKNLRQVDLPCNSISDITPLAELADLTDLEWLDIRINQIGDVSPLAHLTNLTHLYLGDNQISDISPLANLTNLEVLSVFQNSINDITALANMTNMTDLELWENQINDITSLANLTNLEYLDLHFNQISDITPLADLTKLRSLNLQDNNVSDITPLVNLTNLRELRLGGNPISNEDKVLLRELLPDCEISF